MDAGDANVPAPAGVQRLANCADRCLQIQGADPDPQHVDAFAESRRWRAAVGAGFGS
jgi:hypothetical protein